MLGRVHQRVNVFRLLGVMYDSKLTWSEHISKIVGVRVRTGTDPRALRQIGELEKRNLIKQTADNLQNQNPK